MSSVQFTAPRRRKLPLACVLSLAVLATGMHGMPEARAAAVSSSADCLSRPSSQKTVTGDRTFTKNYQANDPPEDHTYDLRGSKMLMNQDRNAAGYSPVGAAIGQSDPAANVCVIGGLFIGQHARSLGWEYLKHRPGGGDKPALRSSGTSGTYVDGVQIDNVMNTFSPLKGNHTYRNVHARYIRDDCLENDNLNDVTITDSLFDGCYVGFSERPNAGSSLWDRRDSSVLRLDRVLLRMQKMPGGYNIFDSSVKTHGSIWKLSNVAGPVAIRNSVIVAEDRTANLDWPSNVSADNVTVVWIGSGEYPGDLPSSGVRVTRDISVWDNARNDWLSRHGCSGFGACNPDRLVNPR